MATTTLDAGVVLLYYNTVDDIDTAKSIVCESDSSFDGSRTTNSEDTKCGILKNLGHQNNKISGNAVTNIEPGPSEGSFSELLTLYANGTKIFFWYRDPSDYIFISGQGWVNNIGTQNKSGDFSRFTYTLEIDGDIETISAPATFDTEFDFTSTVSPAPVELVQATAGATSALTKFRFNKITGPTGLGQNMHLFVGGVEFMSVDFTVDYLTGANRFFEADDTAGVTHSGTFQNLSPYNL